MPDRAAAFLAGTDWRNASRVPLAGDASTRRYERLTRTDGRSAILMVAPASQGQDLDRFLGLAAHLTSLGLSAPEVYCADPAAGFAVIEDFGDGLFVRIANTDPNPQAVIYGAAVEVLLKVQSQPPAPGLTAFNARTMAEQIDPLFDWYSAVIRPPSERERDAVRGELETVLSDFLSARQVMALRDYHAENLFWLPHRDGLRRVGLIDFQDALMADPIYDLVSLLQDARRDVPEDLARAMKLKFCEAKGWERDGFEAAYAVLGVQRNMRIMGIFARLSHLDGKQGYVDLIPRVWTHVKRNLRHPSLAGLAASLEPVLPDPTPENLNALRHPCAAAPTP
ncbi:MAG: phosphotransferase [Rhodobacter sp.]|nr:phosphotransferase [Rhodobacter sp.]